MIKRLMLVVAICLASAGLVINQMNSEMVVTPLNGNILIVAAIACVAFVIIYAMAHSC